jgi:hypothetical protein
MIMEGSAPDAPISRFVLRMKGGDKGFLTNSADIWSPQSTRRRSDAGAERAESRSAAAPGCGV